MYCNKFTFFSDLNVIQPLRCTCTTKPCRAVVTNAFQTFDRRGGVTWKSCVVNFIRHNLILLFTESQWLTTITEESWVTEDATLMEPLTFIKHLWFLPREYCQVSHNQVLDFRGTLSIFKLATCLCFYFGILLIHFVHVIIVIPHYCLISAWFRNVFNVSVLYNKQRRFIYMKTSRFRYCCCRLLAWQSDTSPQCETSDTPFSMENTTLSWLYPERNL